MRNIRKIGFGLGLLAFVYSGNLKSNDKIEPALNTQDSLKYLVDERSGICIEVTPEKDEQYHNTIREVVAISGRREELSLLVVKNERKIHLIKSGDVVESHDVGLGLNPVGAKLWQGDGRTPEGRYEVIEVKDFDNVSRNRYGLALLLNYPNFHDRKNFDEAIRKNQNPEGITSIRGDIEIDRGGDYKDWTRGCIAVQLEGMEPIMRDIENGATVGIVGYVPFQGEWKIDFNCLD